MNDSKNVVDSCKLLIDKNQQSNDKRRASFLRSANNKKKIKKLNDDGNLKNQLFESPVKIYHTEKFESTICPNIIDANVNCNEINNSNAETSEIFHSQIFDSETNCIADIFDEKEINKKATRLNLDKIFKSSYLAHAADMMDTIFNNDSKDDSSESDSGEDENDDTCIAELQIPKLDDFNLMRDINRTINTLIFNIKESNNRNVSHLYNVSTISSNFSSEAFIEELTEWYSMADVSQTYRKSHMELITKFFPISTESILEYKASTEYERVGKQYLDYDCCENGCMVYAGEKNENLLFCSICPGKVSRFLPCTRCRNKSEKSFEKISICNHHSTNRVPRKIIRYRSIKVLLIKLLQFETFREVLKYEFRNENNDEYCSAKDGESYIRNKTEMEEQFNQYKSNLSEDTNVESVIVMGSWFYDGVQTFKSVTSDMSPMFIYFQNLPHCLRNNHGVGAFLLSLFTFKKSGAVENFLMNDCFIAELKELAKGFEIKIDDRRLYVQCRLICHIQDLIGLNSSLKVQNMAKSNEGCIFCNCGSGRPVYFRDSNRPECKYDGHRRYLSIRHPTRTNGYSRQCCPLDYYNTPSHENQWEKESFQKVMDFNLNQVDFENLKICVTNTKIQNKITSFLDPKSQFQCPYNWFDSNSEYSHYKKYLLWYPHACYVPRIKYVRTTSEELANRAIKAIASGMPQQGVKAAWAFLELHYVRFQTDVSPSDPSHDFKAIFTDFLMCIKNEKVSRTNKKRNEIINKELKKEKKQTKKTINMDYNNDRSDIPPWAFTPTEQNLADCYLNCCLLIPLEGSKKLNIPPVFSQSGNLKMTQLVTAFTVLINLILLASKSMRFAYKQHHRMFAGIVNRMRAPTIYKLDVLPLYWRAREWLSLLEGLYPVSELTIMKHFIPDVILHIKNQGPLHTFQTLFGETLVSVAKRKIKVNGGTKVELTAYDKIFEIEEIQMNQCYGRSLKTMMSNLSSTKSEYESLYYDTEEKKFKVDFRQNDLIRGKFNENGTLLPFEFDEIVNCIMNSIEFTSKTIEQAINSSSFYRVISFLKSQTISSKASLYALTERFYVQFIINKNYHDFVIDYMNNKTEDGKFLKSDLSALSDIYECLIKSFKYKLNARINGFNRYGRGFGFRQQEKVILSDLTNKAAEVRKKQNEKDSLENPKYVNYLNYLNHHWFEKCNYNSWCKLETYYAQLNYFFIVNVEGDLNVNSLKIASVSSRKTVYPSFDINCDDLSGNDLYNEILPINHVNLLTPSLREESDLPLFVMFSDILPTVVASIGFVKRGFEFIPIDCNLNSKNKLNMATLEALEKFHEYKIDGYPKIAKLEDPNFPIDILGLIDVSPENCCKREDDVIFNEIKWMDDIWGADEAKNYMN